MEGTQRAPSEARNYVIDLAAVSPTTRRLIEREGTLFLPPKIDRTTDNDSTRCPPTLAPWSAHVGEMNMAQYQGNFRRHYT